MGMVFLCEQVDVGHRYVAIKLLHPRLLEDSQFLQRFRDEAASTGRIKSQNVVTVFDYNQTQNGSPYIVMEYLKGESLRETLRRESVLSLKDAAEIVRQVARGLNAAHTLGIVHRDLKPDNIFLTFDEAGDQLVKIVDFGIAKMRESRTHTSTGISIGTPAYMSYEQCSGMPSDQIDSRSDIYSLAVVVYEMLTGRLPFQSDGDIGDAPVPFDVARPDLSIPPPVEKVIMKALDRDRVNRYGTAPEFSREFGEAIVRSTPTVEYQPKVTVPEPVKPFTKLRSILSIKALIIASSLLFVLSVVWGIWAFKTSAPTVLTGSGISSGKPLDNRSQAKSHELETPSLSIIDPHFVVTSAQPTIPSGRNTGVTRERFDLSSVAKAEESGDLHYNRGEYDKAIADYRRGLRLAPSNFELRDKIGRAQKAKAAEEAIDH